MQKKILILGGGFAGVEAAIFLRKKDYKVTLISNRDYFYIYPTSIWIPTSEVKFEDICVSLDELQKVHKFELIIDEVKQINSMNNEIICSNNSYNYEYLVIAMGSGKIQHKGEENFLSICGNPKESIQIKDKLDELIKKGEGKISIGFGGNSKDNSNVRGGPAFELLFNIHYKLKKLKIRDKFELTFFAPMEKPGARMGEKALDMMDSIFDKLNIKKQFGLKIKSFEKNAVVFEDNYKLLSDFTMFIPAGDGHKVFLNSDLPLNESGLISINDNCEVIKNDKILKNVFAIGDCVAMKGPKWRAKQGHIAEIMARNVAYNIEQIKNNSSKRKSYKEHINILCIMDTGNGAALVYRDDKSAKMIPMPIVGHWLKKTWGWYCKNSKLNKIPRIPGL